MLNRFELFNHLLAIALTKLNLPWPVAIAIVDDIQDTNIVYKINNGTDETVLKKVTDYLNWKVNQAPKPFWFVRSGE